MIAFLRDTALSLLAGTGLGCLVALAIDVMGGR
jgi:hypothetical protein